MTTMFDQIRNKTFDQIDGYLDKGVKDWIDARVFTQVSKQIERQVSGPVQWRVIWQVKEELT